MNLNDKTIPSLRTSMSPQRYNLRLQTNEIYFIVASGYIYISLNLVAIFLALNLVKIRYTVPLSPVSKARKMVRRISTPLFASPSS